MDLAARLKVGVRPVWRLWAEQRDALRIRWRGRGLRWVEFRNFFWPRLKMGLRWWWGAREQTNFTYALTPRNRLHLAHTLSIVCATTPSEVLRYMDEVENDAALRDHLLERRRALGIEGIMEPEIRYGRRIAWYAAVRLRKPKLVIETGVDKGMGSVVLCAALLRNAEEGHPGRFLGTDIAPYAGRLLGAPYDAVGRILYGDSIESLQGIDGPIDLFVNDSDHSAEYEGREYVTVRDKLAPDALIIGDNAHVTDKLIEFSEAEGRRFLFVREAPARHWYPGDGIGFSFR